ncbi:MAG: hypothetical protein N0E58_07140 [Candidatus Thiodiazotropha endolucinida]|uniref:Uncharacterized protein n=1 Tax=Candidatus Thiodiazotropha taylori TaxID=2792791 RepID=A0A9E4NIH3_9GAMM|nr:hypothetical protein [Candidatus Thiodiazotropha taylori]MCW4236025.1 hypothetical protein [Candidatus Thiodiazotropha endolucinida]
MQLSKLFKRLLAVLAITLFIFILVFFFFIRVVEQKKDELVWAHKLYDKCVSFSEMNVADIYLNISQVMQNNYSTEKLKKYKSNSCSLGGTEMCEVYDLYILRSFLMRGSDKDYKLAFVMLDQYKTSKGIDLYHDAMFLNVSVLQTWLQDGSKEKYKKLLEEIRRKDYQDGYFSPPHNQEFCDAFLHDIGDAYLRSGDLLSQLYIYLRVTN